MMSDMTVMSSNRPYLLRALYEWIVDNNLTPLLLVDATIPDTQVPPAYIDDGRIILNISMNAVKGLELGNEFVRFSARFDGVVEELQIPVSAVQAIYARENHVGMLFPEETANTAASAEGSEQTTEESNTDSARSHLRVIK